MKRGDVRAKVKAKMPVGGYKKSPEGIARIAAAARKRMLGDANPFNNSSNATAWLKGAHPDMTSSEREFSEICKTLGVEVAFTGNGDLWIGGKCPDFLVVGTTLVIEITRNILGRKKTYEQERKHHFAQYGYDCLVIWAKDSPPYFKDVSVKQLLASAPRRSL